MILFTLLAILAAASLFAIVRVMREIAEDLRGLDEDERRNADTIREIEKRRDGK